MEFLKYINYTDRLQDKIKNNIDDDTQYKMNQMIDRLFRQVDADNNHFVDVDELYQLLKPLRPGKISKAECSQIIKRFTTKNSERLDQAEFHQVVKAEIQENLTK